MRTKIILNLLIALQVFNIGASDQITPYKFTDAEVSKMKSEGLQAVQPFNYKIPPSCRFTAPRMQPDAPDIVYYLSKPHVETYPIAVMCGGSINKETIGSIIHFHRYFLQECIDLGMAVITIELWGIDGMQIDEQACMHNYTRSQRLADHKTVIGHIKTSPPAGWNGKFVFIGVSEGGPLVTSLTEEYPNDTLATINWSGAGDYSWREELWDFIENIKKTFPWFIKLRLRLPHWLPFNIDVPKNRSEYDEQMNVIDYDPSADKYFMGMTYKYHADALNYPEIQYAKIRTPFLVVAGAQDSFIESSDAFVQKAQAAGANITYVRIADMDHYVRRRPDIIAKSFEWLKEQLKGNSI